MATSGEPTKSVGYGSLNGESILTDLTNMIAGDKDAYRNIADLFVMLSSKIEAQQIELESIGSAYNDAQIRIKTLESDLNYLNSDTESLKYQLALTQDATRTMYLRLEGLNENLNDNLPLNMANTLSKTGVTCTIADIDYVKRIGKYKEGRTRPVLVRFLKEGKRNSILFNRNNINKNKAQNDPLIWINDDVSEETRASRKTVRDIAAMAKQQGNDNLKVHGDGIIVGSVKYRHDELDLLPPNLSVVKAKSRSEETGIYFQGEQSPYSNFYRSRFLDDQGQMYENVEQAFQHKKALAHGNLLVANKIMANRSPKTIKKISKQIQTTKTWRKEEEGLMTNLVRAKFTQNEYLKHKLIRTGNKQFHEATHDMKWGTGAELASRALLTGVWTGQDLLGQIIENIREELKTNANELPGPSQTQSPVTQQRDHNQHNDLEPMSDDDPEVDDIQLHESHGAPPSVSPRAHPLSPVRNRNQEQTDSTPTHRSPATASQTSQTSTGTSFEETSHHEVKETRKSPIQLLQNIIGRNKKPAPRPPRAPSARQQASAGAKSTLRGNRITRASTATKGK